MGKSFFHDRALGAYLGFAVGDALGTTVEFMLPSEIRHNHTSNCGLFSRRAR